MDKEIRYLITVVNNQGYVPQGKEAVYLCDSHTFSLMMKMDGVADYRGNEHRPEFGSPDTGHSDILLFHRQPGLVECRNRHGHSDGCPLYGLKKQQKTRSG